MGFFSPLASASLGYTGERFSYDSTLPEANGARVVFDGIDGVDLEVGQIKRLSDVFDRGTALDQVGLAQCQTISRFQAIRDPELSRRIRPRRTHSQNVTN